MYVLNVVEKMYLLVILIHIILSIYINDIVGKCNRIDKCGYHYTPPQYFTDNPWKRDNSPGEGGGRYDPGSEMRRGRKSVHSFIFIGKMNE